MLALILVAVLLIALASRSWTWPASGRQGRDEGNGESRRPRPDRLPAAVVLAPMAGPIPNLDAFLAALHDQDYPDYRLVLIIEQARESAANSREAAGGSRESATSSGGSATSFRESATNSRKSATSSRESATRSRESACEIAALERAGLPPGTVVVRAAPALTSSQKAANLIAGLGAAAGAEVVVLVDADALPHRGWLRDLVAPLAGGDRGQTPVVTTGFRWYVPDRSAAALVRSAYSAGALSLLTDPRRAFAWGGSLALRRRDLERLGVAGIWRHALSDDMAVTRAVRAAGGEVRFVPDCVLPSFGAIGWRELWEFGVRQALMLRWGDVRLWATILAVHLALAATQVGAIAASLGIGSLPGGLAGRVVAVAVLAAPTLLGAARARARFSQLARRPLARIPGWDGRRHAHIALSPLVAGFTLACLVAAGFRRELTWCGVRYRLGKGGRVEVVGRPW